MKSHHLSDVDHSLPPASCPLCGKECDAASGIGTDDAPKVGDYAVCIRCASVNQYGLGLVLVRCPDSVWQADPEIDQEAIRAARRAILRGNSGGFRGKLP